MLKERIVSYPVCYIIECRYHAPNTRYRECRCYQLPLPLVMFPWSAGLSLTALLKWESFLPIVATSPSPKIILLFLSWSCKSGSGRRQTKHTRWKLWSPRKYPDLLLCFVKRGDRIHIVVGPIWMLRLGYYHWLWGTHSQETFNLCYPIVVVN